MTDQSEDLFVDLDDLPAVRAALATVLPGTQAAVAETDRRLGLARVTLSAGDLQQQLTALVRSPGSAEAVELRIGPGGETASGPEVLVALLRQSLDQLPTGRLSVDRPREQGPVSSLPHVKNGDVLAVAIDDPTDVRVPPGHPSRPRVGIADARPFAHPDLGDRIDGDPLISHAVFTSLLPAHATFVIGTVLSRAPDSTPVCRAVLEPAHSPAEPDNSVWNVSRRLIRFLDDDVDILNMSFACRTGGVEPLPLRRAVDLLTARGIVLVAAAGNSDDFDESNPAYPAKLAGVLSVGAKDDGSGSGFVLTHSPWMNLVAPGIGVAGPFVQGEVTAKEQSGSFPSGYATWSGSSFAAAFVSGELARRMTGSGVDAHAAKEQLLLGGCADVEPFSGRPDGA